MRFQLLVSEVSSCFTEVMYVPERAAVHAYSEVFGGEMFATSHWFFEYVNMHCSSFILCQKVGLPCESNLKMKFPMGCTICPDSFQASTPNNTPLAVRNSGIGGLSFAPVIVTAS